MNRTSTTTQKDNSQSNVFTNILWCTIVLGLFFLMFIQKANAQCAGGLVCKSSINVSLGQNGTATVTPEMIMSSTVGCPPLGTVQIMNSAGQPFGNTVNCSHVGQTFQAKFWHNYGNTCWTNVKVEDKLGPKINCQDRTITCAELPNLAVVQPTAVDNCTPITSLTYTEMTQNFNCNGGNNITGFNGPYEMWKWIKTQKHGSNGEVWTMNMPAEVTLVGATNLPIQTNPRYITSYSAMVTSPGYVKFDWQATGTGSLNVDAFYFTVNDTCVQLTMTGVSSGSFISWLVKPGDFIRFEQASNGDAHNISTRIFNFQFVADIQNIIKRTWTASDANGNTSVCTQNINVRKLTGGNVLFPPSYNDIERPSLECGANTDPSVTGYPIWDLDGNFNTTNDQIVLTQAVPNCLKMGYDDQVLTSCPGGKTVLRSWTIVENCSSQIYKKTQIIKVYDKTKPTITCPANITLSADSPNGCKANVTLPQATATDACSGIESITATWKFGNGYGPHQASTGVHVVTYTAKDKCGNTATCTMTVTIVDNVPPVVVAKSNLVVSLTTNGMATVAATSINDGSSDNCCLDKFEVRRMDDVTGVFGPTVKFQCDDAGKNIQVILKVTDCNGNSNTAMITVEVQDKLAPMFSVCPSNVTVSCGTDLNNLSGYGTPVVVDDCTYNLMYVEKPEINGMCGTGKVIRTWTATDKGGKSAVCTQEIRVLNNTPWNGAINIIWPQDYTVVACSGNNPLDPNSLPVLNSKPSFKNLTPCANPIFNYTDQTFSAGSNVCFKVFRKWTVIDWCQNDPNVPNSGGVWTYTQTLNVVDNQVPVLTIPKDTVILATGKACGTFKVKLPKATATDCSPNITIINNFNNQGAEIDAVFPYGVTTIKFTAADGCGNMTVKEMKVTVKDGSKPTPVCFHGFTTTIMPTGTPGSGGEVWINAKILDAGSNDNCTEKKKLKFSFSANPADTMRSFNCDSLGNRKLSLWVTDEAGNQDYCDTYIIIQNNMGACSGANPINKANLGGTIKTEESKLVEKVKIEITNSTAAPAAFTNIQGKFEFLNLTTGANYNITPNKDTIPINGVSTYDAFLLNRHILGLEPLTSPYKLIAGDIDNNQKLTTADLVELRKLILVVIPKYSNNKSWRFVTKKHVFTNTSNPWTTPFPESAFVPFTVTQLNNDFVGMKIGDLNGSATPSKMSADNSNGAVDYLTADARQNSTKIAFALNNQDFEKGDLVKIPLSLNDVKNLAACQFTFAFNAQMLDFQDFEIGNLIGVDENAFNFKQLEEGKLSFAWFNPSAESIKGDITFCYLIFKAKTSGNLESNVQINNTLTETELSLENGQMFNIALQFEKGTNADFELYQNQPNPYNQHTTIAFKLPKASEVDLTVFDVNGRIIHKTKQFFDKGYQQMLLQKEDLKGNSGVLYYQLSAGENKATKKMIVIE